MEGPEGKQLAERYMREHAQRQEWSKFYSAEELRSTGGTLMSDIDKDIAALERKVQQQRYKRFMRQSALCFWLSLWLGISASVDGNKLPVGQVWGTILAGPFAIGLVFLALVFLIRLFVATEWDKILERFIEP